MRTDIETLEKFISLLIITIMLNVNLKIHFFKVVTFNDSKIMTVGYFKNSKNY